MILLSIQTAIVHSQYEEVFRVCLECYQCSSKSDDIFPYCDDYYWHTLTDSVKYDLLISCPHGKGDYCVKKETEISETRTTIRGCTGKKDNQGNLLSKGCINVSVNDTQEDVYCFCDKPKCNFAFKFKTNIPLTFLPIFFPSLRVYLATF